MLTATWFKGTVAHRARRLLAATVGCALTVALLTALSAFSANAAASMTRRAIADVVVHWQLQLAPGADPAAVTQALTQTTKYQALAEARYASTVAFSAETSGTLQTTGAGVALGLSPDYRSSFPQQVRQLLGNPDGVQVMQQTAANLHVGVGDSLTIQRPGQPDAKVQVAGVIDLPNADSLFQQVGAPPGSGPIAPPDNVIVLPLAQWHSLFDAQVTARPDTVRVQLHVRLAADLPADPTAAYIYVGQLANNLTARTSGAVVVGNNLAARLDGVRGDSLYARLLFLFLGLPGAALAALLTLAVAASGQEHRRREQALLRTRGATTAQIIALAGVEAAVIGLGGVVGGLALAWLVTRLIAPDSSLFGATTALWTLGAALIGLALAAAAVLYPAAVQARRSTVVGARQEVGRTRDPLWQRLGLDFILLALSALVFWQTASSGYKIVLAPEGVAETAVNYFAFVGPVFLWLGAGLLAMRLWSLILGRGRRVVAAALRPVASGLAGVVAASLGRQRASLVRSIALVALAFSFAISTAIFNTTYNAQSRVDAELTNGADVTVTSTTAAPAGDLLTRMAALPGVAAAQPLMHRFAYVGNDLQDMFGIDAAHITEATTIANAYFANADAKATLAALAAQPDGVLVSAETAKDFQLNVGDSLNLRLQGTDHQYHIIPFHFLGIVREFPTAPKDSFLVANADYIAQQTGVAAREVVLLRANEAAPQLAAAVRPVVAGLPGAKVSDIEGAVQVISSSLTAVDLRGLTLLELLFAALLVAGATGLALALGLAERRRTFAILTALGAKRGQTGAFLWAEGLLLLVGGGLVGTALGAGLSQMLVAVLTGVFDPPPDALAVPWPYLALLLATGLVATVIAVLGAQVAARQRVGEALRVG